MFLRGRFVGGAIDSLDNLELKLDGNPFPCDIPDRVYGLIPVVEI